VKNTGEVLAIKDGTASQADTERPAPGLERAESDAPDLPAPVVVADPGEVVLIAVETDGDRLRAAMSGWQDHVGDANGLAWLAERFHAPVPPAGWYADPWSTRQLRWWDGTGWSHHTTKPVPTRWRFRSTKRAPRAEPVPIISGQATGWVLAGIAVSIVGGRVLAHVLGDRLTHSPTIAVLALYVPLFSGLAATSVFVSRRFASGRLSADFGWRFQLGDVLRGPTVLIVASILGGIAVSPWQSDRVIRRTSDLLRYSQTHAPVAAMVVFVVSAVVAAPLLEELVFRGALLRSLSARVGVRWATLLQAACFGAYHLAPGFGRYNIPNMLGTAAFGLVAGIAATRWRRLGPGIVAHALFNTAHVVVVFTTK
jgi:membrane protease YdiL (CAAX protease family)